MFPREHGAYGQLLFPIVTALAIGRPGVSALCLVAAASCAFLAHEPLLVLIGGRGVRARREERHRALGWLAAFAVLAIAFGAAAFVTAPSIWKATMVPAALGAALVILVLAGVGRSVFAEALTAVALASIAYPVALECGATSTAAITCAAAFATGMAAASVAVRAVIARTRNPPARAARAGAVAFAIIATGALLPLQAMWPALPLTVTAVVLALIAPQAKHLRRVGWTLIAATSATAIVLVAALR